jgi:hypothetical protein
MMKSAAVYKRQGSYYTLSSSESKTGGWIDSPPYIALPATTAPEAVGTAALKALAASRTAVPHPTDWDAVVAPLLELAGASSWPEFMEGASHVGLEENHGRIMVTPYRNRGPKNGFVPMTEKTVEVPSPGSAAAVGSVIVQLLSDLEPPRG